MHVCCAVCGVVCDVRCAVKRERERERKRKEREIKQARDGVYARTRNLSHALLRAPLFSFYTMHPCAVQQRILRVHAFVYR